MIETVGGSSKGNAVGAGGRAVETVDDISNCLEIRPGAEGGIYLLVVTLQEPHTLPQGDRRTLPPVPTGEGGLINRADGGGIAR